MGGTIGRAEEVASPRQILEVLEQARARLEASERTRSEPLAIVGMGCRFPAGAEDPHHFWQSLRDGVDGITEVPRERWDVDAYYDPDPTARGKIYTRSGGFLRQVGRFDAAFFGISPREAVGMDPQQQLLLEVSWEALENAGLAPSQLRGSRTGVFAGISMDDHAHASIAAGEPGWFDAYSCLGMQRSVAVGRIAYFLGLMGPAIQLDTACSSSLVAVHLAGQSLRSRECDLALAGGVNLLLSPLSTIGRCALNALSRDGRCKTFDAAADGYGQGEGCGIVVLKRLSDARSAGDNILALVRGSAVNHDGPASGLTVPNEAAQETLIRQALQAAKVAPSDVSYVETHGTGTALGDPIEVSALRSVFAEGRPAKRPLLLGSVKTNLGHLEAAAGIASLIKVILALREEEIPPHLHFEQPNPRIPWDDFPVQVPRERTAWPAGERRRIAGVSSFGLSGTNAHLVVEEAPPRETVEARVDRPLHLLTFSARTQQALQALASRHRDHLGKHPEHRLADVGFTLGSGRSHFSHRLSVLAASPVEARKNLAVFTAGEEAAHVFGGVAPVDHRPKIGFLFSGHGSEYLAMGRQLYETHPGFRRTLERCQEILRPDLEEPLLSVLYPEPGANSPFLEATYTQPALFALGYSLAELWRSWGIEPDAVLGHSVGEYAAACVAGVLSLEAGLKLVAARGRLTQALPRGGAMVALTADMERVEQAVRLHDEVSIAAVNAPRSVVVSGPRRAVRALHAAFEQEGVEGRELEVSHAFHSSLMDPMLAEFEHVASQVSFSPPRTRMISTVTGGLVTDAIANPDYWVRHVRQPVRFVAATEALAQQGCEVFIEIGSRPVLLPLARRCLPETAGLYLPSLRSGRPDWQQLLVSLGHLYIHGVTVDWLGFDRDHPRRRIPLPTYPFQRQTFWRAAAEPEEPAGAPSAEARVVAEFYDGFAEDRIADDSFLTYAPLPEVVPGFSWIRAMADPEDVENHRMVVSAQKEMRRILFRHVDFSSCRNVLDFGCGYGSDLIGFAEQHPHLECCGYTLSARQAEIGNERARQRNLQDRVVIFNRDSAQDGFPDQYDLALGIEVVSHVRNKEALLGNLGRHLRDGATLLLADFISDVTFPIEHETSSSYLIRVEEWSKLLSGNHLRVVECVDVSLEIANFFHDPNFEENLRKVEEVRKSESIKNVVSAFGQMSGLLGKALARYVLFTIRKEGERTEDELYRLNQAALGSPVPYAEVALSCWLYELAWQPSVVRPATGLSEGSPGTWLIFALGPPGCEQDLPKLLGEQGDRVGLVLPGDAYEVLGGGRWSLNLARPDHLKRLLQDIMVAEDLPLKGVVYWADSGEMEPLTEGSLERAQVEGCEYALRLLQALLQFSDSASSRLWLVLRASVPVPGDPAPANVAQAALLGMARTISLEYPRLWGGIFDLPAEPMADEAAALLAFLRSSDGEDQVALRHDERYVPRLVRRRPEEGSEIVLHPGGTYLVTGGLGALGLVVGRWLVARGARHLVLLGRRGACSEAARQAIREFQELGCQVRVAQADVANRDDMIAVMEEIDASERALRGVLHLAGVTCDQATRDLNPERFHAVLRPKVVGTWTLHELTRERSLDFFVLFSSMSSLLGFKRQAPYTAANHFLDVFAHYRRSLGLPALSINWGWWSGGMGTSEAGALLGRRGVLPLPTAQAVEALDLLLGGRSVQAAVWRVDWAVFKEFYEAEAARPLLERIGNRWQESRAPQTVARPSVLQGLDRATPQDGQKLLFGYLGKEVAKILGFEASWTPDPQSGFFDLGMDSLMAVELRHRLELDLGRSLPRTLVFKYPNLEELGRYLLQEFGLEIPSQPVVADSPRPVRSARRATSDFAIVGMSGRFPGSSHLDAFWRHLCDGVESIYFFPGESAASGVLSGLSKDPAYVPAWGLLDGAELFDAEFFAMSPREAERTDPQHRVFLECAWEALEDAGYAPRSPRFQVGVFAGAAPSSYGGQQWAEGGFDMGSHIDRDQDFLPTRVSYKLDLKGPGINVQTACSTSLVAVHLACRSLLDGECDLALAGGVMITWPQRVGYRYTPGGILSPDGHCRAFDARGQGGAFGNGVGIVVLKRLPEALAERDRIRAVIRGSALNNDGATKVGYTAPSVGGQLAVIRAAQARAGVAPETITYVETHGTGTELGDPIEIAALTEAFVDGAGKREKGDPRGIEPPAADRSVASAAGDRHSSVAGSRFIHGSADLEEWVSHTEARLERQLEVQLLSQDPNLKAMLDQLCLSHVHRYLTGEVTISPGVTLNREALREKLRLSPEFRPFLDLFLRILEEGCILRCNAESVKFLKGCNEVTAPRQLESKILATCPGFEGLLDLLRYAVESYGRALTGEVSPVEVLHPDGTNQLIDNRIRETTVHGAMLLYRQLLVSTVAEFIATASGKVRILEFGAGAGLLAWPLLGALDDLGLLTPDRIEYSLTDIGRLYLKQAREKATKLGYEGLDFRRFDITCDPVEQGFAGEGFDLLLGLNSLHGGPRVEETVRHLGALLAPGGFLFAVELVHVEHWHHLIFGLESGWWDFEDFRTLSLFLDHDQWEEVCKKLAFEDVAVFPREARRRSCVDHCFLMARKPEVAPQPAPREEPDLSPVPRDVSSDNGHTCLLGSVKTNIGHLGPAAGAASLIKTVLALEHRQLPPSLHFEEPNPAIDFGPFEVNRELRPWSAGPTPRRAGVSSFGIGGTNAHVVLEEAPPIEGTEPSRRPEHLLVLSARTPSALEQATANLVEHLRGAELDVADVAFTLQVGRTAFQYRRAWVSRDLQEAVEILATPLEPLLSGRREEAPAVAFLFPGQGTQYPNMGRELYEHEPAYRREIDLCCELLTGPLGCDLRHLLYPAPGQKGDAAEKLAQTALTQPALFVVEYALAKLWMEWGVRPQSMIGHSLGEFVAACLADVFSLEDALMLVAERGRLVAELPPGAMLAVPVAAAEAAEYCNEEVTLAVDSAQFCCILAGAIGPIEKVAEQMASHGLESLRLSVSHAFHSPVVEPILERFTKAVRKVALNPPRIPFLSNVTGTWATSADVTEPTYWARHLRQTVQFAAGLEQLVKSAGTVLLEVGPGEALAALARQSSADRVLTSLPPLNPLTPRASQRPPERRHLLTTLGRLWQAGYPVDWEGFHRHEPRRRVGLPTYPFERQSYEIEEGSEESTRPQDHSRSPPSRGLLSTNGVPSFYVPSWSRAPLLSVRQETRTPDLEAGDNSENTLAGAPPWWIFADDDSLGSRMAELLAREGRPVVRVRRGKRLERLGEGIYSIDPAAGGDYRKLLRDLTASGSLPERVVHVWNLTEQMLEPLGIEGFVRAQEPALYSLLFLMQAWQDVEMAASLRLVVVVNGLLEVTGDEALFPEKAPLLTACQVLPKEYPDAVCRVIDILPPGAEAHREAAVIDQLLHESASEFSQNVAYRGSHRWLQEHRQISLPECERSPLRRDGVYLITDGLGDVGSVLAAALAEAGVRLVVTTSIELPAREDWDDWLQSHPAYDHSSLGIRRCRALEGLGAEVLPLRADVTSATEMQRVIGLAEDRFHGIHGVVHAAGAILDPLGAGGVTSRAEIERGVRTRVAGALALAEALHHKDVDFVVLTSSLASLVGRSGGAGQAAADLFLDTFARRQSQDDTVPWTNVSWDHWLFSDAGERFGGVEETMALHRVAGCEALRRVLASRVIGQVLVSGSDFAARLERATLRAAHAASSPALQESSKLYDRPSEIAVPYLEPANLWEREIATIWQGLLGIGNLGRRDNFFDLGGDSLLAIRVLSRLHRRFAARLYLKDFFKAPTMSELAALTAERQGASSGGLVAEEMLEGEL